MPSPGLIESFKTIMKTLLYGLGATLAVANAAMAFVPQAGLSVPVHLLSAVLGVAIVMTAAKGAATPAPVSTPRAPEKPAPTPAATRPIPPVPAPAPSPVGPRAEAEVVALLALLQDKGRLVDFVREDITGASDAQVGAAARVVHAGCRQVLADAFEIDPVRTEAEGTKVVLAPGYDAVAHRLLGSVPAQPPYSGTLLHPGWQVRTVKLPRVTGTSPARPWPVLAPAEVQIG